MKMPWRNDKAEIRAIDIRAPRFPKIAPRSRRDIAEIAPIAPRSTEIAAETTRPPRPDHRARPSALAASRNPEEFLDFARAHTGPSSYFLAPEIVESAAVRLTHRSLGDVARYMLNYIGRDDRYIEETRNCQTFAADFFGFLSGRKGVEPFHPLCRVRYKSRPYLFLYDPKQAT